MAFKHHNWKHHQRLLITQHIMNLSFHTNNPYTNCLTRPRNWTLVY